MNKNNLLRISTYAKYKGVDKETVRFWIKKKKVKTETIDKTIFVVCPEEERRNLGKEERT